MENLSNRRKFLKHGAASAAGIFTLVGMMKSASASSCLQTPPQTSGPFYPGERNFSETSDLTTVNGKRAIGQVVYVKGKILDQKCRPVKNANVELWQACASGKYNNSKDPNPAPLDPHFRYWAEVFTDGNGEYIFKTIIPGAYPAEPGWDRPPHLHFKVSAIGHHELVTQMYFSGEALNGGDLILQDIPEHERGSVIVNFVPSPAGFEPGTLMGEFNISIMTVKP